MLIKTFGAATVGIDATLITIEVHATGGNNFVLVGLPDSSVRESRERIYSAMQVNGFRFPSHSYTINMAPADVKKEGASYDLPLAIGILAGDEQVKSERLGDFLIMGELSLDGSLQPIRGALPITLAARREGFKGIILPMQNAAEAAVADGIEVYGMEHLLDVVRFLNGMQQVEPYRVDVAQLFAESDHAGELDFSDVRGQENVRRAMEVAAAGGHNMLMVGPPGAGKSMMAKRLPSILPPLSLDEALETTKIHSVAGLMQQNGEKHSLIVQRPFRSPHHTITDVALVGGGTNPHPGEISLAHNGVLFLDELPEYKRSALEVMRQPLEDRKITIARTKMSVEFPASFMLVAAMNPCPCGHYGDPTHACTCTPLQVHRYKDRISGPLLDRIDIQVPIQAVPYSELRKREGGEPSAAIRERVVRARKIQQERFQGTGIHCNAQMTSKMLNRYCVIDEAGDRLLQQALTKLGLSARAYDRIRKVARTIADLAGEPNILPPHLMEAISYRSLDREDYGE
ncbi:MAG: YifB family Mg chelatase-like AAA ATPase [Paludibacteraceae bacterium]